jgi:type IV fimbrial biogenesis protein FimT
LAFGVAGTAGPLQRAWRDQSGIHFALFLKGGNGKREAALTFRKDSVEGMKRKAMDSRSSSGLTLMELIIAMAVLAVLIGIASPMIGRFSSGYRLRGAAREVATDLQFARLLAVKENTNYDVVLKTSNSYQVERASDHFPVKSRSFIIDYPEVNLAGATVTFNSRGNLVSTPGNVTVSNPAGTRNIAVGSTGRVKLE